MWVLYVSTPILTTKLYIPPLRPNLVPRPRLIEHLNAGLHQHKLTLVSAPAGFGKTPLIGEWVRALHAPPPGSAAGAQVPSVAWLSLDEDDNDAPRFWTYLVAALQAAAAIDGSIGTELRAILGESQAPPESLLARLVHEIKVGTGDGNRPGQDGCCGDVFRYQ